ncbi:uncharacterized protein LOC124869094 [Girardinichthys multiradiatus]|uniref:uncharacterized protein LOC124869094 n=1 Tax=Girardinichthys multiradiatus TaxID=208333 RepID=UPI001FAB9A7E|nr:uncharacterized protein LOC124869094 [Girardinichthys multiradiatus]
MLSSTSWLAVTCWLINSAGSQKIRTVACEGSVAELQCDKDQVISVSRAIYGRSDQKTCISGRPVHQIQNVQCSSSSDKVVQSCNGKQSCSITATNSEFGDPCVGTYKYLEVDYTCKLPERSSQNGPTVACEGSVAQLQCDKDQVISVSRAIYGRSDQKTCISGRPVHQIQNVQCSSSSDKVVQSCNGKQSCSITATNSEFGDPCVGTYKYLEVDYTCKLPERSSQNGPTVACEGSVAQLQCDKDQVISVSRAIYGRSDQKTCISGRPVHQIQNVRCSSSSDKVVQSCNGKQSCSITATNSEFGDPCVGTYKYLEVDYTCKLPERSSQNGPTVACEGSVAQLQCDKDQVISVSRAIYGRSDQKTCISGRPVHQIQNVQCSSSSDKVVQSCNGKQSCSITATNSEFGDPCVGTYKYLEVDYTCKLPERSSQNGPTVACEGSVAQLQCDKDQVISVTRAIYGRSDQKTCISGRPVHQIQNVRCSSSSDKVVQSCNGKQSCSITATNSEFGDPCVGTYKYLEVDYTCKLPERSSQNGPTVACEGSVAQLQCDKDQVISVSRAIYGRSDQKTCISGRPVHQIQNVQCSSSSDKVVQSCNGKQSCSITATNSEFGDPCVGTYKYLEVDYTCKLPERSSQNGPTVACEGSVAQLQCDKDQVISVTRAIYGRSDQKTCISGRPVHQVQNVRCSSSSDKVVQSCNGKQSCSITATNSEFGDPCVGTYKYLEVDYTCKLPERSSQNGPTVACEGSVAQLQCDKDQVISVSRAIYGRSDQKTCISGRPVHQIQNVRCSSSSDKVVQSCNGKQSCSITATNSEFGDPCVGTYKYLEVDYTCKLPERSSQNGPTVACEGSVAQLQCDKGKVIFVTRAIYGRSDQKTCISGRPVHQIQNVQCSSSSDKVSQSCNEKQSCSITATNSEFGDPCVGTYKYLEVDYLCYDAVTG